MDGGENTDGPTIYYFHTFTSEPSVVVTHYGSNQFNMTVANQNPEKFSPRYRNVNTNVRANTIGCYWFAIGY